MSFTQLFVSGNDQQPLTHVDGLTVATATDETELKGAIAELERDMTRSGVRRGVVVISWDLASRMLGPVPQTLIRKGISLNRSTNVNVSEGAKRFVKDYLDVRHWVVG